MSVAVLGAGGGGLSAAVELTLAGHDVRLWNRGAAALEPHRARNAICYDGVLGTGAVSVESMSGDLTQTVAGAEAVVVCLPAIVHERLFVDLAALSCTAPIVLNPGHTGGALHARAVFAAAGVLLPPLAELSTLTYVARVNDGVVHTTGRAATVRAGALPGGQAALAAAQRLFPASDPVPDVLASSLSNVNLVLHPPGAVLAAAWVEATGGAFTFYVDAMTPGVGRIMAQLDAERLAVAAAYGHRLPSLLGEMAAIGTVEPARAESGDLPSAISGGEANRRIAAPDSFAHRYYREDFAFGLVPFRALAAIVGVPIPTTDALLFLASAAVGDDLDASGLGAERLGVAGVGRDELGRLVGQLAERGAC